jgi:hypothetical protein
MGRGDWKATTIGNDYNGWVLAGLFFLQKLTSLAATLASIITQLEKRGLSAVNRTVPIAHG